MKNRDRKTTLAKARDLLRQGDRRAAEALLREWLSSGPDDPQVLALLAQICSQTGRFDEGVAFLERARILDRGSLPLALGLIDMRIAHRDATGAEDLAIAVCNEHPGDARPRLRLANIRMDTGNLAGAAEAAREALAVSPGQPVALSLLVESGEMGNQEDLLEKIRQALADGTDLAAPMRAMLHFAAGRLCQRLKRFDEAFDQFLAGNAARRQDLEKNGLGHSRRTVEHELSRLAETFDAAGFKAAGGSESRQPVFIVGMARSGTSLTEQILASHPSVTGAGELHAIPRIAEGLRRTVGYPSLLPAASVEAAAKKYLGQTERFAADVVRVVDKMPMNVLHLGLIARLFPNARIIHCRRDPLDTCVSCFTEYFRIPGLAWTYDLGDLGHMYCQYIRIMEHWRAVLPAGMMLELDYEETVRDLEGQARRLIDFIGLEWDDRCLAFHETSRTVVTPSRGQVRKPIYGSSIGRWRHYESRLGKLIDELAACGCGTGTGSS